MSLDYNPYGIYRSPKLPTQKRSTVLRGDLSDDGKFYTCWNCGFTVDSTKHAIGVGSGVGQGTYVDEAHLIDENGVHFIYEDGNEIVISYDRFKPVISGGCPFCGSKNYR